MKVSTAKAIFEVAVVVAVSLLLVFTVKDCARQLRPDPPAPQIDTLYIRDTVLVQTPPPPAKTVYLRDTVLLAYCDTIRDTVAVFLPIEQVTVADSLYTAWISGVAPRLDSIAIYRQKEVITITQKVPAPRWSLGLQAGVGITPKGVQPYLGAGLTYRLPL